MRNREDSNGRIAAAMIVVGLALGVAVLWAAPGAANNANAWGFDTANLDKSCKPCDDFYQFAMGGWMKANPIPAEYSSWGTFTQLADKNQQNLRQILEAAESAKAATGSNEQKIQVAQAFSISGCRWILQYPLVRTHGSS
jgi:putative endopeptidase